MGGTEAEGGDVVVERYFGAVNDALRPLGPRRRAEIVTEMRAHLAQRRREAAGLSTAAMLRELGDPADIAAQAGVAGDGAARGPRWTSADIWRLVSLGLTVVVWPLGLVAAALSGLWEKRPLVYAGVTLLVGTLFGYLALLVTGFNLAPTHSGTLPYAA